jgi:hypothetical protein
LLYFSACGEILSCDELPPNAKEALVRVIIHWDEAEKSSKPVNGMRVHLFADDGNHLRADRPADGGDIYVATGVDYAPYAYDYHGNEGIFFRSEGAEGDFEAHLPSAPDGYGLAAGLSPAETAVAEPDDTTFYLHRIDTLFHIHPDSVDNETPRELHFYPDNMLTDFTFCIYDIANTQRIAYATTALSGLAASYDMDKQTRSTTASTVISDDFRVRGDSLMGSICSFGISDFATYNNRLSIVVRTKARATAAASWGYIYGGQWEDTVRQQLIGAWGEDGSDAERAEWRAQNHGYDILLANDGRLIVPEDPPNGGDDGGDDGPFDIGVTEWDNVDVDL